jgi:hypothetical protein
MLRALFSIPVLAFVVACASVPEPATAADRVVFEDDTGQIVLHAAGGFTQVRG